MSNLNKMLRLWLVYVQVLSIKLWHMRRDGKTENAKLRGNFATYLNAYNNCTQTLNALTHTNTHARTRCVIFS